MNKLIVSFLVVICAQFAFAAEVQWTDRLEGEDVIGGVLMIEDGDYSSLLNNSFSDVTSFGFIRLGLNQELDMYYEGTSASALHLIEVDLSILTYNSSGVAQFPAQTITLEMEYASHDGAIVLDASDYRLPGVHKFEVSVDDVRVKGVSVNSLDNYVYLEAGFFAERYYTLDLSSSPIVTPQMVEYNSDGSMNLVGVSVPYGVLGTGSSTDEIFLNWTYIDGAEYYDLEWTWVDNYSETDIDQIRLPSDIELSEQDFQRNSTRIRTSDQSYRIPNVFAKGYLIYRVRGVGRWQDDPKKDLYGKWSAGTNGPVHVGNWNSSYVAISKDHSYLDPLRLTKNWQYQATYAEEGKKKEVTQYFDGSLRGRQTVTRINSDDHSVVGETIYDNEGRGVIQILPVPQDNPSIEYYPDLNQANGVPYNHQHFDWQDDNSNCAPGGAEALDNSVGAAHYYSVNGFDPATDQDWQKYVPESSGFPFTQVEYTPDNTGRIRNQSGVGASHKIGSEHETYYYYTQPSQQELDRLFGYKVGYKSRYKKNMVVDANGQVSISYLDAQGRVIATAMAGENPDQFNPLLSESDITYHNKMNTDLLNNGNPYAVAAGSPMVVDDAQDDNVLGTTGRFGSHADELRFETQLAVPFDADYDFEYQLENGSYIEICGTENAPISGVDFPYVYDFELTLKDDCGNDAFAWAYTDGVNNIGNTVNNVQVVGTNGTAMPPIIEPAVALDQGSYTLYKSLRINQEALEAYKEIYLDHTQNVCLIDPADFVTLTNDNCEDDCAACVASLGVDQDAYKLRIAKDLNLLEETITSYPQNTMSDNGYFTDQHYDQQYLDLVAECEAPCQPLLACEVYRNLLLGDVSPGGQYASTVSGTPGPISIFTSGYWYTNFMGSNANINNYLNSDGTVAEIEAYPTTAVHISGVGFRYQLTPNGQPVEYDVEPWELGMDEFIQLFEPQWAEQLLEFHPEYEFLVYMEELCTQTDLIPTASGGTVELSSDEFDHILREQLMELSDAQALTLNNNVNGIDFIGTPAVNHPLYAQDPYFLHDYGFIHPAYGGFDLNQLKEDLMLEALDTEYKGTGMTMIKYAIKTAVYGNDYSVSIPSEGWAEVLDASTFSLEQKNAIWETYKSYYSSYKSEINQLLMDFYGFGVNYGDPIDASGIFNGCIGSDPLTVGILPSFSFSSSYIPTMLNGFYDLWGIGSGSATFPTALCSSDYNSQVIRIARIDALSNPSSSVLNNAAEINSGGDFMQWDENGLCPLNADMQLLLDDLFTNHAAPIVGNQLISQADVSTFVPDLYEAFTGINVPTSAGLSNVMFNPAISGTGLNLTLTAANLPSFSSTISITKPTRTTGGATNILDELDWNNLNATTNVGWKILSVGQSHPFGVNQVNIVLVVDHANTPTETEFDEYICTYTIANAATTNFNDCPDAQNPANDPYCEREEEFEVALMELLNTLIQEGDIGNTFYLTSAPYNELYGQTILSELIDGSSPQWDGLAGTITTSLGVFDLGTAIPQDIVLVNNVNLYPSNSTIEIDWVTVTGSTPIFGGNGIAVYESNGDDGFDFSCPCEEDIVDKDLSDFVVDMLSTQSNGATNTYLNDISDFIGIDNPIIFDWEQISTGIIFDIYDGNSCYLVNGDGEMICEGSPCSIYIELDPSVIGGSNVTTEASYSGQNEFLLTLNGSPVSVTIECLEIEECDDCPPGGPLDPISCTSAYEDYELEMETVHGAPFTVGSIEEEIYNYEHLISEYIFCQSGYAYITESYLNYLSQLSITAGDNANYLTIAEFGDTPLGYSDDLLNPAVTAYGDPNNPSSGNSYSDPTSSQYMSWNDFVANIYMVENPGICPAITIPPSFAVPVPNEIPCNQWENNIDLVNTQNQLSIYLEQMGDAFEQAYIEGAMTDADEGARELFKEKHNDKEYHYTLYYYDRAGNLIQTVPPKGVRRFEYDDTGAPVSSSPQIDASQDVSATQEAIANYREDLSNVNPTDLGTSSARLAPDHEFETEYRYNSLNQLVYQKTPDGGESRFAYDALGRLVMSQNAKQKSANQYSYTKYDFLGRVIEVGELTYGSNSLESGINANGRFTLLQQTGGPNGPYLQVESNTVNSPNFPDNLTMNREEVTRTIYDELGGVTAPITGGTSAQTFASAIQIRNLFGNEYAYDNTRNRIVGVIYQEAYDESLNNYESGTFYDYDVHGNVKHLIQVHVSPSLLALNQHIKHVEYEYDLVSGNVNKVIYQREEDDQFIHRYCYDSDNRITIAETSNDGVVYEKDAKYFYYDHGPLARTEIGENKVQSSDYAYTIQGWLKTVNGEEIDETTMMGQDGKPGQLNAMGGQDAFGFSLSYFDNDYSSYSQSQMLNYTASLSNTSTSLYNGNIRLMETALVDEFQNMVPGTAIKTHETKYTYDQLNRINSMEGAYNAVGQSSVESGYSSTYSFDENGNLETLAREAVNDQGISVLMDNFTYDYDNTSGGFNGGENNRLLSVNDQTGASQFLNIDIDNSMPANNYDYDEIGQLIEDKDEGIKNITWKVTNKVEEVQIDTDQDNLIDKTIHFDYDPMGSRIAKHVTNITYGSGSNNSAVFSTVSTFYVLDAQGNSMSIYDFSTKTSKLEMKERAMYGSSRLGLEQVNQLMDFQEMETSNLVDLSNISLASANSSGSNCGKLGWNFDDYNSFLISAQYDNSQSFDGDSDIDLKITFDPASIAPNTSGSYAARYFFNTMPGEEYTFNYSIVDFNADQAGVYPMRCDNNDILQNTLVSGVGTNSITFIAESQTTQIKWYIINTTPSPAGSDVSHITLSDIEIIGPGNIFGTGGAISNSTPYISENFIGDKRFELSNHLGNVLEVISDRKLPIVSGSPDVTAFYTADVISYSDYYPYGMVMPNREGNETSDSYRYGYQGSEMDDEVKGRKGTSYTTYYRSLDPRIGRWLSIDPRTKELPSQSPFVSMDNNPIMYNDVFGDWVPEVQISNCIDETTGETRKHGFLYARMEDGDDAASLADFLDVPLEEAQKMFDDMGADNTTLINSDAADRINETIEEYLNPSENDYIDDIYIADGWEENYNCWESTLSLARGQVPDFDHTIDEGKTFAVALRNTSEFENVSETPEKYKFGETAIRFADGSSNTTHGATYLGTSRDGTIYVWTKNGRIEAPKVATLKATKKRWGKVQGSGPKKNEGGFYNVR